MNQARQIKVQFILFLVLFVAFMATFLFLYRKNHQQFKQDIQSRAVQNVRIISVLYEMETKLYIHQNSWERFIKTENQKWYVYTKESKRSIQEEFEWLEEFNIHNFNTWIRVEDYVTTNALKELETVIGEYHKGKDDFDQFQRLFYLLRYNLEFYFNDNFKVADGLKDLTMPKDELIDRVRERAELFFSAFDLLTNSYNTKFWDYSQSQNSRFELNSQYYFKALAISFVLLFVYALVIMIGLFKYFHHQKVREDELVVLGAKDVDTGLFNKGSFEVLAKQELERAKRRGYHLSFMLVRVSPLDQIRQDLGPLSASRLLYQLGESIKSSCRQYDGLFRYSEDSFVLLLSEVDAKKINAVVTRFKRKFPAKSFMIKNDQTEVIPQLSMGFSVYPEDGQELQELLDFAENNVSVDFDARKVHDDIEGLRIKENSSEDERVKHLKVAFVGKEGDDEVAADEESVPEGELQEEQPQSDEGAAAEEEVESNPEAEAQLAAEPAEQEPEPEPESEPVVETEPVAEPAAEAEVETEASAKEEQNLEQPEPDSEPEPELEPEPEPEPEPESTQPEQADSTPEEPQEPEEVDMPDVVAALNQEAAESIPDDPQEISQVAASEVSDQEIADQVEPEPELEPEPADTDEKYPQAQSEQDPQGAIGDVEVVQEGEADVIMVDFDDEQTDDPAEKFRRKQRARRRRTS